MSDYTFKEECDCGNKPVLKELGMCSVCTFGEASSMWEWLDEKWTGKERKLAQQYVAETINEVKLVDRKGNVDPIVAMLLHIDEPVLDKMEALL